MLKRHDPIRRAENLKKGMLAVLRSGLLSDRAYDMHQCKRTENESKMRRDADERWAHESQGCQPFVSRSLAGLLRSLTYFDHGTAIRQGQAFSDLGSFCIRHLRLDNSRK